MNQPKKSAIDKTHPLWEWSKPSKKDKDKYRKVTGLELKEVGVMKKKFWDKYLEIIFGKEPND